MITEILSAIEDEVQRNDLADFYDSHKDRLFAFVVSRTGEPDTAEDILQDAFLRIVKYPKTFFKIPAHKRVPYVVIIIRNIICDRNKKNRETGTLTGDMADRTLSVEDAVIGEIARDELMAFIGKLPEKQSTVLMLKIIYDMSYAEIAQALGLPETTVAKRLSDSYGKIREFLKRNE